MTSRHGGQLLVECLHALGATRGFGVPGESYLAVLDALHDTRGRLDFILCRQEGGAAFMAAAHGKLTGSPGIGFVTRGPGATNAAIGVHTAMQDSAPMLLFVGQVDTGFRGREAFQEVDYDAMFRPLAKWTVEIDRVERIPELVSRAWICAVSGRPGPVVVALPEDMLACRTAIPALAGPPALFEAGPSPAAMDAVMAALAAATRPLMLVGGGGWTPAGRRDLQHFAEAADLPVAAVFRYQDLFDNNSRCYIGDAGVGMTPALRAAIEQADLVLAVNIRFGEISTDGYTLFRMPQPARRLVHVHASDRELGKVYRPDPGIHAGPNAFAAAAAARVAPSGVTPSGVTPSGVTPSGVTPSGTVKTTGDWRAAARRAWEADQTAPPQPGPVDMGVVMAELAARLPADAILTNGAGNFSIWPGKFFRFGPGHRLLAPQSGAMGYGLPAAIAARLAAPDRTVVCFAGDGDFQMTCQELGTARQAGAQPVVLLLNNGTYGTIRMHQERHFPGRVSGTDLENPDFVALAGAYGFHAERIVATDAVGPALDRALAAPDGAVLDLAIAAEAIAPRLTLSGLRAAAGKAGTGQAGTGQAGAENP